MMHSSWLHIKWFCCSLNILFVQVRATDTGVPRRSSLATVEINVEDINDNRPSFNRLMYLETVKEKQPSGTDVFIAQAVDNDAGM